jgi:hypothetical protein
MNEPYEIYVHHKRFVWVRKDLRGEHRKYCLCHHCHSFKPDTPLNCHIAQETYELCVKHDLVLPVWECPHFKPIIGAIDGTPPSRLRRRAALKARS